MKKLLYSAFILMTLTSCEKEQIPIDKTVVFDGIDENIKPGDDFF